MTFNPTHPTFKTNRPAQAIRVLSGLLQTRADAGVPLKKDQLPQYVWTRCPFLTNEGHEEACAALVGQCID